MALADDDDALNIWEQAVVWFWEPLFYACGWLYGFFSTVYRRSGGDGG